VIPAERPAVEFQQYRLFATEAQVFMRFHRITSENTTQRVTIARRAHRQGNVHYSDVVLTRDDLLKIVDELMIRIDVMSDEDPPDLPA
jgi:hypothetical protein